MNKKIITFTALGLLGMVVAGSVYAANHWHVTLDDVEGVHNASGWARVKVSEKENGSYRVGALIKVKDLPTPEGTIYEGWLVDEDTGYKLSIGAFSTNDDGRGKLKFRQDMVYPPLYDKLVVTRESLNDTDPNPDTPVLVGDL
jgi:hypothetical protein